MGRRGTAMKNVILLALISFYFLTPTAGNASYYIHLKNGGKLLTPLYWQEGGEIYFFYAGGIVGVKSRDIGRIEKGSGGVHGDGDSSPDQLIPRENPPRIITPSPAKTEETKTGKEKIDIADYKNRKDRLEKELEDLLEKRRAAKSRKDETARKRLTEEIINVSSQIYQMTDDVTLKNGGQLPEGWWKK